MKRILLFIVVSLMAFTGKVYAQEQVVITPPGSSILHNTTDNKNRPRSLTSDVIECCYYDGELTFSSESDIDSLDIYIEEESTGATYYYSIQDINQPIFISLNPTSYYITCRTKNGEQYEGVLTLY